jgi:molybdopterin-synthase adenylyltransferase
VALTNRQIERYSRQLIVPAFGGVAQERLLAARVLLLGDYAGTDVLAYLIGAGVGHIYLWADLDPAASNAIIARMRDLNPDSTLRVFPRVARDRVASDRVAQDHTVYDRGAPDRVAPDKYLGEFTEFNLALVLADDEAALDRTRALCDRRTNVASDFGIILVRLDASPRIAVIPRRPPCPRCASTGDLFGPIGAHADNAGFVTSLAALEAIKLLARFGAPPQPTLIEFRGYQSSARIIDSVPGSTCACTAAQVANNPTK